MEKEVMIEIGTGYADYRRGYISVYQTTSTVVNLTINRSPYKRRYTHEWFFGYVANGGNQMDQAVAKFHSLVDTYRARGWRVKVTE